MLEFLWSGGSKAEPQVPPGAAREEKKCTADLEDTAPPPQSTPQPLFEQPQVGDCPLGVAEPAPEMAAVQPVSQTAADTQPTHHPDGIDEASALSAAEPGVAVDLAHDFEAGLRRYQRGASPGRRLVQKAAGKTEPLTPQQRLLLLDTWRRSGLPAADFAAMVGVTKHTLYAWKRKFDKQGPAGLLDRPRGGPSGSKLPDLTKRTIVLLKETNPTWGCQRISDMLLRGPALPASPSAVARVLHEAGYELEEVATRPHPDHVRSFERARPNQLWQTDLFTFVLKRQNRRVYLVAFMDDHSRFIVGYGLHASQSSALVLEVLRAAITSYGTPEEILTDNGSQYVTWRGKSAFNKELEKRGIKQVVSAPQHPQTLGKIERFWGTLWRECIARAVFIDLGDAQRRIGLFMDHYNFQRPNKGAGGLAPADRFFGAASEVKKTLTARVAANALELARTGIPKKPFYLTGQVGGQPFSVHAEGERVIMTGPDGARQEVDLAAPAERAPAEAIPEPVCPAGVVRSLAEEGEEEPGAPGESPLDAGLERLRQAWQETPGGEA